MLWKDNIYECIVLICVNELAITLKDLRKFIEILKQKNKDYGRAYAYWTNMVRTLAKKQDIVFEATTYGSLILRESLFRRN